MIGTCDRIGLRKVRNLASSIERKKQARQKQLFKYLSVLVMLLLLLQLTVFFTSTTCYQDTIDAPLRIKH